MHTYLRYSIDSPPLKFMSSCFLQDLISDLKSELSGNFENVVVALFAKPRDFDAECLKNAIKGVGTDETVILDNYSIITI